MQERDKQGTISFKLEVLEGLDIMLVTNNVDFPCQKIILGETLTESAVTMSPTLQNTGLQAQYFYYFV